MANHQKPQANRTRPIVLRFRVTEEEQALIHAKMQKLKTNNLAAYMRKMAIDGYIVEVDYSDLKAVCYEMQKIGTNINQIAKRVNSTSRIYDQEFTALKKGMEKIWRLLKSSLSKCG